MSADIHIITRANMNLLDAVAPDVFDHPIQPALLAEFCDQPGHFMAVAERDHLVVGQIRAMLHYNPDEPPILYIDNLGVTPNQKRKGIATALFAAALDWGRSHSIGSYWVATELDNDEGNRFYESLDLKGVQMIYYEDDLS
ncbi:aminoglycoside 6'-N-acetyltransferase [Maritalea myrionectae]|uniref:Aminoglycoside 6'-N-acetyltransferase n=1 Tax=Maritalea myrionectae TaxID=454601 RepID=A0A2R4M959_9HYPH|nr:GNAT family N-acetyltransferase [Maritalea myrionectae]AVX02567.1 aminoglycoside 6'-N-acetyltransferase [Maritalea myrionectae]